MLLPTHVAAVESHPAKKKVTSRKPTMLLPTQVAAVESHPAKIIISDNKLKHMGAAQIIPAPMKQNHPG